MDKCNDCLYNTNDYVCRPECSGCDGESNYRPNRRVLEAENAQLSAELEQVKAERDAAIIEIYSFATCSICKHLSECDEIGGRCEGRDFGGCCNDDTIVPRFEWRGLEVR